MTQMSLPRLWTNFFYSGQLHVAQPLSYGAYLCIDFPKRINNNTGKGSTSILSLYCLCLFCHIPIALKQLLIHKTFDLMRKTRFKMMLVAAFAAIAMLFAGAGQLQAQTDGDGDLLALPTGSFVSQGEAELLLITQVIDLKGFIETLIPGTVTYKTTERAIFYYSVIQDGVVSGQNVPVAIVLGLENVSQDMYGATPAELFGLRQNAINMLSQ
ncbi:MAG: hypothetical protein IPL49_21365 [Saprospirales bacterium]|nr:hypothetical protein [Saprospirales bacterium]